MKVVEYLSLGNGKRKPYNAFKAPLDFSILDFSKATLDDTFIIVPYMPADHASIFGEVAELAVVELNDINMDKDSTPYVDMEKTLFTLTFDTLDSSPASGAMFEISVFPYVHTAAERAELLEWGRKCDEAHGVGDYREDSEEDVWKDIFQREDSFYTENKKPGIAWQQVTLTAAERRKVDKLIFDHLKINPA